MGALVVHSLQSSLVALPSVLNGLVMNGVLGLVCPSLVSSLLPVFERVDAPTCRVSKYSIGLLKNKLNQATFKKRNIKLVCVISEACIFFSVFYSSIIK